MNILKIIGGLLIILFIIAVVFFAYLGGFRSVEIERGAFGPAEIIYSIHRGPYQELGQSWERFESEWESAGLEKCDSLAVYLDPPDTPKAQLRSVLGCRIDALSEGEQERLKEAFPSFTLPPSDALIGVFPFKNYASFMLAPMKVYPEMDKRMQADNLHGAVSIEAYGVVGETEEIRIIMPVNIDRAAYQPLIDAF